MMDKQTSKLNVNFLVLTISDDSTPSVVYRIKPLLKDIPKYVCGFRMKPIPKIFFRRILLIRDLLWADCLLIQKKVLSRLELAIVCCFVKDIYYDIDDAIHYPHGTDAISDVRKSRKIRNKLSRLVKRSKGVIVGNQFLKNEIIAMGQNNVAIAYQPIDVNKFRSKETFYKEKNKKDQSVVFGWIGSPINIKYLTIIENALEKLQIEFSQLIVMVVCKKPWISEKCRVENYYWTLEKEVELLENFDVGLMPLEDDPFTRGKNNFKTLQYMSMSIPPLASSVGANIEYINHGVNGYLVRNQEEWYEKGRALILDDRKRIEMGGAARQSVEEKYSNEILSSKYTGILMKWL